MIAGNPNRFAIECEPIERSDGWLFGRFRFWLCGKPVGNWDDYADLRGCVRWLQDFANKPRNRFEKSLASAKAEDIYRQLYDSVIGVGAVPTSIQDAFSRFHISHLGMSSFEQIEMLLLVDEHGSERCFWRKSGSSSIEECRLWRNEMEIVARDFCEKFERESRSI